MNKSIIHDIKGGVESILRLMNGNLSQVSETEARFSARISLETQKFEDVCIAFSPISDLFELLFTLKIQQGEGNLKLTQDGLIILNWNEDPDLSPPHLDSQFERIYQELATQLNEQSIGSNNLKSMLNDLTPSAALIEIELQISIEKNILINKLEMPSSVKPVFYIYSEKLIRELERASFIEFSILLMPQKLGFLLILLGDINGASSGSNIGILGLDSWIEGLSKLQIEDSALKKVENALLFRNDEVNWEGFDTNLTPYHLNIQKSSLDKDKLPSILDARLSMIAVAYLANQVKLKNGLLECSFKGYKKVSALASPNMNQSKMMFKLFNWIYDNSSSDKLDIVRHIITLRVSGEDQENYIEILKNADEILESAKNNFQTFIKQSVEFYFDTRVKISNYLQKFNEDVGVKISSLASQLLENLYKTVGIVLGVAVTIILDSKYTYTIILLTSVLYFLYILFIFFASLSTTYLRFTTNIKEYNESFERFGDIFSKSEVNKLKGNTFQRAKWGFLGIYTFVSVIYGLLGTFAICLANIIFRLLL